jgi:hypothetical protein
LGGSLDEAVPFQAVDQDGDGAGADPEAGAQGRHNLGAVLGQLVLDRIAARKADPEFQAAVRRVVKANQRVFERLART